MYKTVSLHPKNKEEEEEMEEGIEVNVLALHLQGPVFNAHPNPSHTHKSSVEGRRPKSICISGCLLTPHGCLLEAQLEKEHAAPMGHPQGSYPSQEYSVLLGIQGGTAYLTPS